MHYSSSEILICPQEALILPLFHFINFKKFGNSKSHSFYDFAATKSYFKIFFSTNSSYSIQIKFKPAILGSVTMVGFG